MNTPLSDDLILVEAIGKFNEEYPAKFLAGQKKYATPLLDKDCLAEALPEVYDLVSYLVAEGMKKRRALELAKEIYSRLGGAEFLMQKDFEILMELIDLLSPKPLAVKKTIWQNGPPEGEGEPPKLQRELPL